MPTPHERLELIFIINGENYAQHAAVDAMLVQAVEAALVQSQNTGRDVSEWEVRDIHGTLLDKASTPRELGLKNGAHLFLTLKIGAGGFDQRSSRGN